MKKISFAILVLVLSLFAIPASAQAASAETATTSQIFTFAMTPDIERDRDPENFSYLAFAKDLPDGRTVVEFLFSQSIDQKMAALDGPTEIKATKGMKHYGATMPYPHVYTLYYHTADITDCDLVKDVTKFGKFVWKTMGKPAYDDALGLGPMRVTELKAPAIPLKCGKI